MNTSLISCLWKGEETHGGGGGEQRERTCSEGREGGLFRENVEAVRRTQHVSPIIRFGSIRGGPFGFPSEGERERGRPFSGWFRPRSVGGDPAGDDLVATHLVLFRWTSARGLVGSELSNIGTLDLENTGPHHQPSYRLLGWCFGSDSGRAQRFGKSTTGSAIRNRGMRSASSFSGGVGCSVVLFRSPCL